MTDSLDPRSHDLVAQRREELLRLFPEAKSEGDGGVDFSKLREQLGLVEDAGPERFGMSWPGKKEAIKAAQTRSIGTLLPVRDESVDFDTTQNVIIEGDNLEVLKLLQKSYLGKVKMIYIDPPYNTGNDFVYPDNYSESLQTYLEYTGQVNAEGRRFSTNTETDGRFHSKWMSMMYPRLVLARSLMADDGVIFISIDDNEVDNLGILLNEVFGERNVERYVWDVRERGQIPKTPRSTVRREHEYLFACWKIQSSMRFNRYLDRPYENNTTWSNPDDDHRGPWMSGNLSRSDEKMGSGSKYFSIITPTGVEYKRTWTVDRNEYDALFSDGRIHFADGGNGVPRRKIFRTDEVQVTQSSIFQDLGSSQSGAGTVRDLVGIDFPYPKPVKLISRLVALSTSPTGSDLVLDFFAGSGTTAHAVLDRNKLDGGSRRFILVQLPELISDETSSKCGQSTSIVDLARERVKSAGQAIVQEIVAQELGNAVPPDVGFRAFQLSPSNFRVWNADATRGDEKVLNEQLRLHEDHVVEGRSGLDVVFEVLLKSKYPLTADVVEQKVGGGPVWAVDSGSLIVVVDQGIDLSGIRQLAARDPKPVSVVMLDRCFGRDDVKANARKIFEDAGIDFRTI